jgi:hypothetical protein
MNRAILLCLAVLMATLLALAARVPAAQIVLTPEEAAKTVSIKDLKASPSSVSGVLVNNTPHIVRDIQLDIQYHWLWANEFKPGPTPPGRTDNIKLSKELKPGESTTFSYVPDPPLENRKDGQYDPEVVVAGYEVVIPGTTTGR